MPKQITERELLIVEIAKVCAQNFGTFNPEPHFGLAEKILDRISQYAAATANLAEGKKPA